MLNKNTKPYKWILLYTQKYLQKMSTLILKENVDNEIYY